MPRAGGKRQGTPGKGYANRTDMAADPNMGINTAATGGLQAPAPQLGPTTPPMLSRTPEDSPMLTDPTNRPGEPLTAGSDFGPGPDSSALGLPTYGTQRDTDVETLKKMLPEFTAAAKFEGAPATFRSLVSYLSRL